MKNNKILYILVFFTVLWGCKKEYEAPYEINDISWYHSGFTSPLYETPIGKHGAFMDMSQGAISHKWELLDEGTYFLSGKFERTDTTEYLETLITSKEQRTSTEKTINLLFLTGGQKRVRLYNEFSEPVVYKGLDTLEAKNIGGKWVIDTTFIVDVFKNLEPEAKVYGPDGSIVLNTIEEGELTEPKIIKINGGEKLTLLDATTVGRPDSRKWVTVGGFPGESTSSRVAISYEVKGKYRIKLESIRDHNTKVNQTKLRQLPLIVEVLSSTPYNIVGGISETKDEVLSFQVNGKVGDVSKAAGEFTVSVNNTVLTAPIAIPVSKVTSTVDVASATWIHLKLTDPIYNTDNIKVSYSGKGITSLDGRSLDAFADVDVAIYKPLTQNMIADGGFEAGTASDAWEPTPESIESKVDPNNSMEFSTDNPASGSYCYHLDNKTSGKWAGVWNNKHMKLEEGKTYKYSFKYRVAVKTAGVGFEPRIHFGNEENTYISDRFNGFWTSYGPADNTWKNSEQTFTYNKKADNANDTGFMFIHLLNYGVVDMYFDDIMLVMYEERPAPTK